MHPLQQALRNKKDSKKSVFLQRFFKTGKNGYAEDDGFIGLTVPHKIVGRFIFEDTKDISLLIKLSKSENLWERRIAMISTAYFISKNEFDETIQISELLLKDKHDLIHKAVGWMLREVGKRDLSVLKSFLKKHYKTMPRTMLRYAIERFPEKERKEWLQK